MKALFNFVYIECDPPTNNPGMRIAQFKTTKQKDDCLANRSLLLDSLNYSSKAIHKESKRLSNSMSKHQQIYSSVERLLFKLYFQVNRN